MELTFAGLPLPLRITPPVKLTDEAILRFSAENDGFPMELDSNGDLLVMSPTGLESSDSNAEIIAELILWNRTLETPGGVTESNGGYRLPDGSMRVPDAGWFSAEKKQSLTRSQRQRFTPFAPDFVIELRSSSDALKHLHEKMDMWIRNGVSLAWLIDPAQRSVTVYRANRSPEVLHNIAAVHGEGLVSGFVLPLERIFTE